MEEILKDERFSHIATDSNFRHIPKNVRKIKVDNRFKGMFKNKKLSHKRRVDERGRTLDLDSSENLKKHYNREEDSSESEDDKKVDSSITNIENKKSKKKNKVKNDFNIKCDLNLIEDDRKTMSSEEKELNEFDLESLSKNKKRNKIKNELKVVNELNTVNDECNKNLYKKSHKVNKNPQIASSKQNNDFNKKETNQMVSVDNCKRDKVIKSSGSIGDLRFHIESESSEESSSSEDEKHKTAKKAGEESVVESSSSDEEESESSESEAGDSFDHQWEEQQERAPETDEITKRLAVCNMDWDRIRAVDLYSVFNSFKPPDSSLISVKIYPSEYGLKRMEEEKLKGPPELVEKTLNSDEEEDLDDKKGGRYNREKLRQYQLNRLKYYYAVVDCDTSETANALYDHLNGMEYESSSVRFDLRFIPDDMTFDQEPCSVAENPDLTEYKPNLFVTTALQQVKVGLTWDETDPQRREIFQKAFTEPDDIEKDIREYLASSSGDSELDDEIKDEEEGKVKLSTQERINKYKALLESLNEQEKEKNKEKYEMEITWESGIKEKTQNLVKEKIEEKTSLTPFEELLKKKKEKQKMKKKEKNAKNQEEEIQNSESDSSASIDNHIKDSKKRNSKNIDELRLISDSKEHEEINVRKSKKKKLKQEKPDNIQVDINDPRFSAVYTSPLYNIDPSDPHFKRTPGNLAIIAEKQRRLKNRSASSQEIPHKKFKSK